MRLRRILPLLLVGLLLTAEWAQAQPQAPRGRATLVGTVVDSTTGEPLSNVNVFIASSMRGTTTDDQGHFRLTNIPLGAQQLYVSIVGYKAESRSLNLREPRVYRFEFQLQEQVVEGEGIVVEAERDEKWMERYEKFKKAFLGETPKAGKTEIQNPEVLSFDGGVGSLEAFAARPLVIENRALGYRVEYHLEDFKLTPRRTQYDGEPLFEELDGTPAEKAEWREARREAFLGSFHHLMLAMLAGRVEEQGFKLYHRPASTSDMSASSGVGSATPTMSGQRYPIEVDEVMEKGETPSERILDFQGFVEVVYLGEQQSDAYNTWRSQYASGRGVSGRAPRYQTSQFWLERGPATVDYKGEIVERYGVTVSGYFAFERVADQVPKEYRPR